MIDKETRQSLWHPMIVFNNLMKLEQTKTVGAEAGGIMWYSHDSKSLVYADQILLKFSCAMSFKKFPFDSHKCNLSYETVSKYEYKF